jgi:hypothetical protein
MSGKRDYKHIYGKGLYSKELADALKELRNADVEGFTNLILGVLRFDPDQAVDDNAPSSKKISALNKMIDYLETTERYEDCAFIRDIVKRIDE